MVAWKVFVFREVMGAAGFGEQEVKRRWEVRRRIIVCVLLFIAGVGWWLSVFGVIISKVGIFRLNFYVLLS